MKKREREANRNEFFVLISEFLKKKRIFEKKNEFFFEKWNGIAAEKTWRWVEGKWSLKSFCRSLKSELESGTLYIF